MLSWLSRAAWILTLVSLLASSATARVDRVEILSRADVQDGKPFGGIGAYERITGRVYFKVNPANLHNRQIVDLDKAKRDSAAEVEFSPALYLLKPNNLTPANSTSPFQAPTHS